MNFNTRRRNFTNAGQRFAMNEEKKEKKNTINLNLNDCTV